jgi:transcriptional regulator with XRE-family HTH domain
MSEEKTTYEDFRQTAAEYADEKDTHDMLTDPEAHPPPAEEPAGAHGERLKSIREKHGFSLQELSERTGIPVDSLKDIEQGALLPPLGQLIKISKALSLKMSDVISTGKEAFTIVRAGERESFSRFGKAKMQSAGYEYQSLAPNKKDRMMEPFIVTLNPASHDELSSHDGQEFIYVLEGEMEVVVEDHRDVLKPGDSVYYDSSTMHLVKAHGDKPAKILAVLTS